MIATENVATVVRETLLEHELQTERAGADFARTLIEDQKMAGARVLLSGELGAGKTSFSRGFLTGCGHTGAVTSPTYTLIERYQTTAGVVCHLDLYRLADPEELEFIGFRDLLDEGVALLIEWPERAPELHATATAVVSILYHQPTGRKLCLSYPLPHG